MISPLVLPIAGDDNDNSKGFYLISSQLVSIAGDDIPDRQGAAWGILCQQLASPLGRHGRVSGLVKDFPQTVSAPGILAACSGPTFR